MRKNPLTLLSLFAAPLFLIPATSQAASISGTSILVTSQFNSDAPQQSNFADITAFRQNGDVFSDWMIGWDTGTNLTFIPGTDNGDQRTRNVFDLNFSGNPLANDFNSTDMLTLTLQLDSGLVFNTNYMAITIAKDIQVPNSSVNGGTLTLNIAGLDQLAGNGGQLELIFDVEPQGFASLPEPSTLLLGLPVLALLLFSFRRRRA
ncbi:MAG TPA: hypothetical protein VN519_15855 [Bryobacteraceae bacterium]|nr:hypothetical protein [Bryobacteraceae bacterium]